MHFESNGTLTFKDLKFQSGTFPHLVQQPLLWSYLTRNRSLFDLSSQFTFSEKMVAQSRVSSRADHQKAIFRWPTRVYLNLSRPFWSPGSQWKDAAGAWFKKELFGGDRAPLSSSLFSSLQKAVKSPYIDSGITFSSTTFLPQNRISPASNGSIKFLFSRPGLIFSAIYLQDFDYLLKAKFKVLLFTLSH